MKLVSVKERIKEYFFLHPSEQLRLRQIERNAKVPLPSAIKYTKELVSEGVLKTIEMGDVTFYTTAQESSTYRRQKSLYTTAQLYALLETRDEKNTTIILHGKGAQGTDTETTPLTLYIEAKEKTNFPHTAKNLNRTITCTIVKSFKEIKDNETKNSIINGITLSGRLEVFK